MNLRVYRADDIAASGQITAQIAEAIRTAYVVVADITGLNANVMWELGFAHALGRPVVTINQDISSSPFDVRNWRQVAYSSTPTTHDHQRLTEHLRDTLPEE